MIIKPSAPLALELLFGRYTILSSWSSLHVSMLQRMAKRMATSILKLCPLHPLPCVLTFGRCRVAGVQLVLLYAGSRRGQEQARTRPVPHKSVGGRVRQIRGGSCLEATPRKRCNPQRSHTKVTRPLHLGSRSVNSRTPPVVQYITFPHARPIFSGR